MSALRAIALLAIYSFHAWQNAGSPMLPVDLGPLGTVQIGLIMWRGEIGTTVFFVLSGFLLSLPYWLGSDERLLPFMGRRLLRIWPPLVVAILVHVLLVRMWRQPLWLGQVASHTLLVHNLFEFSVFGISAPWWYVATQVQLYLAVPLFFTVLRPLRNRSLLTDATTGVFWLVCGVIATPCFVLLTQLVTTLSPDPRWLVADGLVWHTSVAVHIAQFATGIALGRVYLLLIQERFRYWRWLAPLAWIAVAAYWPKQYLMPKSFWPARPLLLAGLILAVSFVAQHKRAATVLDWAPLRWLGSISYGTYLYHGLALHLVFHHYRDTLARWPLMTHLSVQLALALVLSIIAGAASTYLVERPVQRWPRRRAG